MTRVFVSHSSADNYFVDFLIELLKFHRVGVWADRSELHGGDPFTADIEQALAACDSMVVVVSPHAHGSQWMTREISTFTAVHPGRPVIPLVLTADADVGAVHEGLRLVKQLRCYESTLESFRELLRQLGYTLFPEIENRQTPDRRTAVRRSGERRAGPVAQRLRIGIWQGYSTLTGRTEFDPLERTIDVGRLARFLADASSPLNGFEFTDRQTGEASRPQFPLLEEMAFASWRSRTREGLLGAVYIIDDIIDGLAATYEIRPRNRRSCERRSEVSRRSGAVPEA